MILLFLVVAGYGVSARKNARSATRDHSVALPGVARVAFKRLNKKGEQMKKCLYNATEIAFRKKFGIYPDDLFIYLRLSGFSRDTYKFIQREMELLYNEMKFKYEFRPISDFDGECPF